MRAREKSTLETQNQQLRRLIPTSFSLIPPLFLPRPTIISCPKFQIQFQNSNFEFEIRNLNSNFEFEFEFQIPISNSNSKFEFGFRIRNLNFEFEIRNSNFEFELRIWISKLTPFCAPVWCPSPMISAIWVRNSNLKFEFDIRIRNSNFEFEIRISNFEFHGRGGISKFEIRISRFEIRNSCPVSVTFAKIKGQLASGAQFWRMLRKLGKNGALTEAQCSFLPSLRNCFKFSLP